MYDIINKRVQRIAIVFICLSSVGIIFSFYEFITIEEDEFIVLFNKFGIEISNYVFMKKTQMTLNIIFNIPILLFSFLLYRLKNVGRIGFNISIVFFLFYMIMSPFAFDVKLPLPKNPLSYDENIIGIDLVIGLIINFIKAGVLIAILNYINKPKVKEIYF